jgi:futalosine hydrolase
MNLLLVSATPFEIAPLLQHLQTKFTQREPAHFQHGELRVAVLVTGVGAPLTAFAMGKVLALKKYDLAINAGICGSYDQEKNLGKVVEITSEYFGDCGVEEANGDFSSVFDLNLIEPNQVPFTNRELLNPNPGNFLRSVKGLTVNKVHGSAPSIEAIIRHYPAAEVETMESAAFFYACLMEHQPFLAIRSISNYVEPRNRANWNIPLAVENLNKILVEMMDHW